MGCTSCRGGCISAISMAEIPKAHTSALPSYPWPNDDDDLENCLLLLSVPLLLFSSPPPPLLPSLEITSGAIQCGVPTNVFARSFAPSCNCVATPKSASFTSPRLVNKMFPHLMSLCILPFSCKYCNPLNAPKQTYATTSSLNPLFTTLDTKNAFKMSRTLPPPQNSMTIQTCEQFEVTNDLKYFVTFSCLDACKTSISFSMSRLMPSFCCFINASSSFSSSSIGVNFLLLLLSKNGSIFIATSSSSSSSFSSFSVRIMDALYTAPNEPIPMSSESVYFSSSLFSFFFSLRGLVRSSVSSSPKTSSSWSSWLSDMTTIDVYAWRKNGENTGVVTNSFPH